MTNLHSIEVNVNKLIKGSKLLKVKNRQSEVAVSNIYKEIIQKKHKLNRMENAYQLMLMLNTFRQAKQNIHEQQKVGNFLSAQKLFRNAEITYFKSLKPVSVANNAEETLTKLKQYLSEESKKELISCYKAFIKEACEIDTSESGTVKDKLEPTYQSVCDESYFLNISALNETMDIGTGGSAKLPFRFKLADPDNNQQAKIEKYIADLALELMNFNANIFNPVELKSAMQELNFECLIHARDALMFSIYTADSSGKRKGSFDVLRPGLIFQFDQFKRCFGRNLLAINQNWLGI